MASLKKILSRTSGLMGKVKFMTGTVIAIAVTYGAYKISVATQLSYIKAMRTAPPYVSPNTQKLPFDTEDPSLRPPSPAELAAELPPRAKSQPCVTSHDKAHALFLCLRVKDVDAQRVASSVAKLQQYVDEVEAPAISCCGNHRIFAGVGFGPEFYQKLKVGAPYPYSNGKHDQLSQEGVGGDILIHAKSNNPWMLQRLRQVVLEKLPQGSVLSREETCGQHKDAEIVARRQSPRELLSILNYQYAKGELAPQPPALPCKPNKPHLTFVQESDKEGTELHRRDRAVDPVTGGSFALTQRWVHDVGLVDSCSNIIMNQWVSKAWEHCACTGDNGELRFKPLNSLGADLANQYTDRWMNEAYKDSLTTQRKKQPDDKTVCSPGSDCSPGVAGIVRQSMPYLKPGGEFGLFFISYCNTPRQHQLLMDRLIASKCCGNRLNSACSEVFQMSHNVHSAMWYFPGLEELARLQR